MTAGALQPTHCRATVDPGNRHQPAVGLVRTFAGPGCARGRYGPEVQSEQLPRLAIRPYPAQYAKPWKLKNGEQAIIRPIRPEDEPLLIRLHEALSERSVYLRYFQPLKLSQRTAHERLTRICFIDYDREMALVLERKNKAGEPEIVAIGRLSKLRGRNEAELAVLVDDRHQHLGMGT